MIDTREAGAGSYPDAPESKYKCYNFTMRIDCIMKGYVYAESEEEARELISQTDYEECDIVDKNDITSIEIESLEVE